LAERSSGAHKKVKSFVSNSGYTRPILSLALFFGAVCFIALILIGPTPSEAGKRTAQRAASAATNQQATLDESAAAATLIT
jgi:hypothetical protein